MKRISLLGVGCFSRGGQRERRYYKNNSENLRSRLGREEVLLLVVDEVRDVALLAQRHLKAVQGLGPPAAPLLVTAKSTHQPPNKLRQRPFTRLTPTQRIYAT